MCLYTLWKSARGKRIDGIGFKEFCLESDGRVTSSVVGAGPFKIGRWYTARVEQGRATLIADRGGKYPAGFHVWLESPSYTSGLYRVAYRGILACGPNPGPTVVVRQIMILGKVE